MALLVPLAGLVLIAALFALDVLPRLLGAIAAALYRCIRKT